VTETKQELAYIISVVIEVLIRQRFKLPGFCTLSRVPDPTTTRHSTLKVTAWISTLWKKCRTACSAVRPTARRAGSTRRWSNANKNPHRHPKLKAVLKETAGIGTEATRASITEILSDLRTHRHPLRSSSTGYQ